jgi:hypothetical protein
MLILLAIIQEAKHPSSLIHDPSFIQLHSHLSMRQPLVLKRMRDDTRDLVTSSSRLSNDTLQLINLRLRTTESTEPLLRQLTCTLVLAVSEEFDNSALVWCKSIIIVSAHTLTPSGKKEETYPATSFTISLTKAVLLLK